MNATQPGRSKGRFRRSYIEDRDAHRAAEVLKKRRQRLGRARYAGIDRGIPAAPRCEGEHGDQARGLLRGGVERGHTARGLPGEDHALWIHVGQLPGELVGRQHVPRGGALAAPVVRTAALARVFCKCAPRFAEPAAQRHDHGIAARHEGARRLDEERGRLQKAIARTFADTVVENDGAERSIAARPKDGERKRVMPVGHRNPDVVADIG